eukprot:TRINITY_DN30050_c0_g1_i1.p1 TRINITY_DN30050_c0_g1~~TRINITY_DN30050_c0_g1_i1.p1  ORF type:complete len:676 (+),score=185.07 TRINITY_DN30050_c0_g1_i1:78-2105(+)
MNMNLSERGLADLDVRKLAQSKEELAALTVVKTLNASGNELTKVAGLQSLSSVGHVNLSRNKLVSLRGFPLTVTHLNVSHNSVASLEALTVLSSLQTLDISHNKVTSLAGISPQAPLRNLRASFNFITGLQPLRGLNASALRHLALDSNYIKDPNELRVLTVCSGVTQLSLTSNPFALKYKAYQRDVVDVLPSLQQLDGIQVRLDAGADTHVPKGSIGPYTQPAAPFDAPGAEARDSHAEPPAGRYDGARESLAQILAASPAAHNIPQPQGGDAPPLSTDVISALSALARELGIPQAARSSPRRAPSGDLHDAQQVDPSMSPGLLRLRTPLEDSRLRELLECSRRLPQPKTPNRADNLPFHADEPAPQRPQQASGRRQEVRIMTPPQAMKRRHDACDDAWRRASPDSDLAMMTDARRLEVRCEELQRLLEEAQTRNAYLEKEAARKSEELSNANRVITDQTRAIGEYKQENHALAEKYRVLKERADKLSREFKLVHRTNAGLRAQAGAGNTNQSLVNQSVESAAAMLAVPPPPARRYNTPPHRERNSASPAGTRPRRSATPPVMSHGQDTTHGSLQPALRNSMLSSSSSQRVGKARDVRPGAAARPAVKGKTRPDRPPHDSPAAPGAKRSASTDGYIATPALAEPRRSSTPTSRGGSQSQPNVTRVLTHVSPAKS